MTLFIDHCGPLVRYDSAVLKVSDLNPEAEICWRMPRLELFKMGIRCIWAALRSHA